MYKAHHNRCPHWYKSDLINWAVKYYGVWVFDHKGNKRRSKSYFKSMKMKQLRFVWYNPTKWKGARQCTENGITS